ncbi:homeobox-leucine zipper protein HAT22-like [Diospyros lotus]|uniref:homeobox-leucine zipper protein HAT22-like n=1 Tax=Diospyros lotus TaxID=55363 RepID=UPI0022560B5B|nr:homeobox-leucine zipper protein HAT22-like [Diospyros lotus]
MVSSEDICNIGLSLSSTSIYHRPDDHHPHQTKKNKSLLKFDDVLPSLTLRLSASSDQEEKVDGESIALHRQVSSLSTTAISSHSNSSVKRERDLSGEEVELEKESSKILSDDHQDEAASVIRKKLRLTKEQSVVLEASFKEHSNLNPKQKDALSKQLNLRPRQVEVWFQNRRARTKLKQTEVECDLLKKCCETLTDENRRLRKELHDLRSLREKPQPFCVQIPAATLTVCPSCERVGGGGGVDSENTSKTPFSVGAKPHFYNPFNHPSAAC